MMVELLLREYWSKSTAFLVPLTRLKIDEHLSIKAYANWKDYSIKYNQLVVKIEYGQRFEHFQDYLRKALNLKGKAFAIEVYDYEGFTIIIFDISGWSKDVNKFLGGKYSQFSTEAKNLIQDYHVKVINGKRTIDIMVISCLAPNDKQKILDNMTPIDYAIKHYVMAGNIKKIDYNTETLWRNIGELCSKCDEEVETLVLDKSQVDIPINMV